MTQDEIRKILLDSGVPENVVDYVMQFEQSGWIHLFWVGLYVAVMVASFFAMLPIMNHYEKKAIAATNAIATSQNALLFESSLNISPLIFIFAIIFGAAVITGYLPFLLPKSVSAQAFVASFSSDENRYFASRTIHHMRENNESANDPKNFISRFLLSPMKFFIWPTILLASLGLMVGTMETNARTIVTQFGLQRAPIMPWADDELNSWDELEAVLLGCNYTKGGGSLKYVLKFKSGKRFNLADIDMKPVEGDWLSTLEKVDQILVENNANFKRWQWLKRNPLHPKCLKAQEARYTPQEMQRLRRLLRIGTLEGD